MPRLPLILLSLLATLAQAEPATLEYARVDDTPLQLDLHLPEQRDAPALIVWIHGGAWRAGSRKRVPINPLLEKGWAIASVDYRLSPQAKFPAQIHDIKAAIRYLRANPENLPYDATRIVVAGESAGGHLAALVGVTNHHPQLEGKVGHHLQQSSEVQAIVSLFGASNLTTILKQSTPHGLKVRVPALDLFLGAQPQDDPQTAQLASPVFHIDTQDPPLLLVHGDQDPQMPINQSHELQGQYEAHHLPCEFKVLHGAAHGGAPFYTEERINHIDTFLRAQFQGRP
ncbi:alpha/beta hydrolase [Pelagicoccus sp. SDUM812005]|uniref:alpha/beta hydrolase n=1 Tax=Pelagicoccus sp. SDUM812005 TaxID=3041257 RepID=UPI0028100F88|nr:alpha/beta hydrolase [Pelagicoccus sp. SDUM812005]MDQ8182665.1 alpha/beta hydrolase [Pelagicoccus sp. SDUM812005]